LPLRCYYLFCTSAVFSHPSIHTVRSFTQYQYNLSSIHQYSAHAHCSHTATDEDLYFVFLLKHKCARPHISSPSTRDFYIQKFIVPIVWRSASLFPKRYTVPYMAAAGIGASNYYKSCISNRLHTPYMSRLASLKSIQSFMMSARV
jgi:hypothetical protein